MMFVNRSEGLLWGWRDKEARSLKASILAHLNSVEYQRFLEEGRRIDPLYLPLIWPPEKSRRLAKKHPSSMNCGCFFDMPNRKESNSCLHALSLVHTRGNIK